MWRMIQESKVTKKIKRAFVDGRLVVTTVPFLTSSGTDITLPKEPDMFNFSFAIANYNCAENLNCRSGHRYKDNEIL